MIRHSYLDQKVQAIYWYLSIGKTRLALSFQKKCRCYQALFEIKVKLKGYLELGVFAPFNNSTVAGKTSADIRGLWLSLEMIFLETGMSTVRLLM